MKVESLNGDIVPITTVGRILGIGLMYTGTVLFITFTGILVSFWTKKEFAVEIEPIGKEIQLEEKEQARIEERLDEILARIKGLEERKK